VYRQEGLTISILAGNPIKERTQAPYTHSILQIKWRILNFKEITTGSIAYKKES
jgi:hypothetical protein